jgi:hypothetical protein
MGALVEAVAMEIYLNSDIEKKLEDLYVPKLQMMGMTPIQAKGVFTDLLKKAKEESVEEGTWNLPENFGDILLEKESTDGKIKSWLAMKRNEGVRDQDIRAWWNLHDLERRISVEFDELGSSTQFFRLKDEDRISEEEATKAVGRFFPTYGDPNEVCFTTGDDRPLPYELKGRVDKYLERVAQVDKEAWKGEVQGTSTLNAFIRKEIKKGNL